MTDVTTDLNLQTATIKWQELQRFFAQGLVWQVQLGQDLLEVATAMVEDQSARIKIWQHEGVLNLVPDQQAADWISNDASVWAVAVAPFVIVQEL